MKKPTRLELKMKRRRRNFFVFLIFLFFSLSFILANKFGYFNIASIEVVGNSRLEKEDIISETGIYKGQNIFKAKLRPGEKNLSKLTYIEEVKIQRKFPKNILISVHERKALGQIEENQKFIIIDDKAFILEVLDEESQALTRITGLEIDNNQPGQSLINDSKDNFYYFYNSGNSLGVIDKIKDLNLTNYEEIEFTLKNGIFVAFGNLYNVEYKWNILNEVLKDISDKSLSVKMILMNKGDNPVIVLNEE